MELDVAIIGAGVVGCAIARELSRYRLSVGVFEREADVSFGTTKANSGIVHAGFHSPPGKLKSRLCVQGCRIFPALAEELDVLYRKNGALMVAQTAEELPALEAFLAQGRENGLTDLRLLDRAEMLGLEPNLAPELAGALWAPGSGIVVPFDLAIALADNARVNGVRFFFGAAVEAVEARPGEFLLRAGKARHRARYVVNAAGLHAASVAGLIGDGSFTIRARKGQEYLLDKRLEGLVRRTIYPLPTRVSKGILVIPTVDGNIMLGPTAEDIMGLDDLATTGAGWREIHGQVKHLVPGIAAQDLITSFAGLRAVGPTDDFIIAPSPVAPHWINVAGIESPGLTSAPAIAGYVREILAEHGLGLEENPRFKPERRVVRFHRLSLLERERLIRKNPAYGRIVCRCEQVTEAEIVTAIEAGATTMDGIKFRTRAGMGRCQGGFCSPRVLQILARELGVEPAAITKRGPGSNLLAGWTRKPACRREDRAASQ